MTDKEKIRELREFIERYIAYLEPGRSRSHAVQVQALGLVEHKMRELGLWEHEDERG